MFGLFHHVLSGPSWVFFMASNGELPRCVFPSGTDRWEMVESETIQTSIVWWYSKRSNMFPTPTYQCTLNSITPLPVLLSWLQIENLLGLFSHSIIAAIHTRYCRLLLSPLSLVRRSTTHCDNPWIWKTLQKQSPSFPPAPIPSSLRWASMKSLQGEGYALWMYRPWYKENRDFHPNHVPLKRTGGGANGCWGFIW